MLTGHIADALSISYDIQRENETDYYCGLFEPRFIEVQGKHIEVYGSIDIDSLSEDAILEMANDTENESVVFCIDQGLPEKLPVEIPW